MTYVGHRRVHSQPCNRRPRALQEVSRSGVKLFDQKGVPLLLTTMSDNTSFVLQSVGKVSYDQRPIPESVASTSTVTFLQ